MVLEYLPATQLVHAVDPSVREYLPDSQLVQALELETLEYLPGEQFKHVSILVPPKT